MFKKPFIYIAIALFIGSIFSYIQAEEQYKDPSYREYSSLRRECISNRSDCVTARSTSGTAFYNFYTNLIETYDDMIEDIEEKMEEYEDKATTYYIITGLLVSVAIAMLILAITQAKRANRNAYAPYGASYGYMTGEQYINQYGQPTYPSNENNTPYGNYNNSPTGYVNNQFSQHYENNQNNQNNQ